MAGKREKVTVWGVASFPGARPIKVADLSPTAADKRMRELRASGWTGVLTRPVGKPYDTTPPRAASSAGGRSSGS